MMQVHHGSMNHRATYLSTEWAEVLRKTARDHVI